MRISLEVTKSKLKLRLGLGMYSNSERYQAHQQEQMGYTEVIGGVQGGKGEGEGLYVGMYPSVRIYQAELQTEPNQ